MLASSTSFGRADGVEAFSSFRYAEVYVGPLLEGVVGTGIVLEVQSSEFLPR